MCMSEVEMHDLSGGKYCKYGSYRAVLYYIANAAVVAGSSWFTVNIHYHYDGRFYL